MRAKYTLNIVYSVTYGKCHAQTGKVMTKFSVVTNQLLITMAGLIMDYLSSSRIRKEAF